MCRNARGSLTVLNLGRLTSERGAASAQCGMNSQSNGLQSGTLGSTSTITWGVEGWGFWLPDSLACAITRNCIFVTSPRLAALALPAPAPPKLFADLFLKDADLTMSLKLNSAADAEEVNNSTDARTAEATRVLSLMLIVMFALNGLGCWLGCAERVEKINGGGV